MFSQCQQMVINSDAAGARLDVYLVSRFVAPKADGDVSRSRIQKLIEQGRVTVNGQNVKASARLKLNDVIQVENPPPLETGLEAEALPLEVIYEDRDCLVINKAPGMVVHPAAGCTRGTLVNALLHHCADLQGIGGERRPGIVHRLDKDTSGVMIVAKNAFALEQLARQFKFRTARKEYLALVWGKLPAEGGVIDRPIGRHRSSRKKMSSVHSITKSREAVTEWKVEKSYPLEGSPLGQWASWVRLRPRTGRTHQIRVHLADLGYAIVGDKVYGRRKKHATNGMTALLESFPRQVLHAEILALDHPRTGAAMVFSAAVAGDIRELLHQLDARPTAELQKGG